MAEGCCSLEEKSSYPRFRPFTKTIPYIFCIRIYILCGTKSVPGTNYWEPPSGHQDPNPRCARTSLERVVSQLLRVAPLEVRACQGTSEGSLGEVLMLEHARCRSNSSCIKPALAATPQ